MMKVVDELGQNHFVCQRLSCSYEEMEIKKRVVKPTVQATDQKPRKIVVKKTSAVVDGAKKKLVLKKPAADSKTSESYTWETVIEVVRPSKLTYHQSRREQKQVFASSSHVIEETPSMGGSFADLIKASEERKKRDRQKKRK
ncbi:MAG: hypothetical protein EOM15_08085 [Spirochaetia bacterium]|nr:hypothetical protein [Spirochaetia bacterium]